MRKAEQTPWHVACPRSCSAGWQYSARSDQLHEAEIPTKMFNSESCRSLTQSHFCTLVILPLTSPVEHPAI